MLRNFMKLILLESFLIGFLAPQRVFIHLNLVDFDRTAAQILNGENSRRVLTGSSNNTLKFSYNLIKLADREVKKLANQGFISPPDLQVTLNMRNIIAKVDKYSNVIDQVFTSLLISFLIFFYLFFFYLLNRIHQVISFLLFLN